MSQHHTADPKVTGGVLQEATAVGTQKKSRTEDGGAAKEAKAERGRDSGRGEGRQQHSQTIQKGTTGI